MCTLARDTVAAIRKRGRIYEVGGAVRDRLLNVQSPVKDRDYLVTGIPYEDLTDILKYHGRVDLVGRSFGVIKFTQHRRSGTFTFDITLPRREHSTGTHHTDFEVDFDPNLPVEDDLVRRDFTINAMAYELETEHLVDPLGGLIDLKSRQLRMTSEQSFEEDPLRMLRAVQFAARFNFLVEPTTFAAMRKFAPLISTVSAERVNEELNKLLTLAKEPSHGFRLMESAGLLRHVLPELQVTVGVSQPGPYHKYDVFEHTMHVIDAAPQRLRIRLACLFHDICKPQARRVIDDGKAATFYGHEVTGSRVAKTVMSRLRYPKDLSQEVQTLVERHMFTTDVTDKGLRRLVKRVGIPLIFDLLDLRRADVVGQGMGGHTDDVDRFEQEIRDELAKQPPFGYGDLALKGDDIMQMFDLQPSPIVGKILAYLLEKALDDPGDNTVAKMEAHAREAYELYRDSIIVNRSKEPNA